MFTHKEQLLHQLEGAISDLARQNTNEYRARYYAEARALLKSLVVLDWIETAEVEQWRADIHATHQQAIGQCQAAGESVDALVIDQAAFCLKNLAMAGTHPRIKVVAPVAQPARRSAGGNCRSSESRAGMTFEQARTAELAVLTQTAEAIRSAPALAELFSLGASALDRLHTALADNLISAEEADQWRSKLDAAEDERLVEL